MSTEAVSPRADADADGGVPGDKRKRYELLQDCREMVVSRLCKVVHEALARMADDLTGAALKSCRRDEQQALMDAIAIVRQNRDEIETSFRRAFMDCFERRLFGKQSPAGAGNAAFDGELSLVDDAVITDKLAVDRIVHRTRGKLDPDEVLGIRARLAALMDRDWFDEAQHPASPEAVFESLKDALAKVAPRPEVQSALLDAFEPHVSANLNGVYSTVNDRLKAQRVLPRIRPQVAVQAASRRARTDAPDGAAAAGGPVGAIADGVGALGDAHAMMASAYHPALAARVDAAIAQLAQGAPAARMSAARLLTDPATFGVADLPLPSVKPPLLDALSRLQDASGVPAGPQIFNALVERARDTGSPLDQLTVEIVSLVFDYIYADTRLADTIKQQLLRLQVVAVKAALIDRSFFARRQHPMRRLIDRISEIAADPDADVGAGSPLVQGLTATVDEILAQFDRDLQIFEAALERIEDVAQRETARRSESIARLAREAERKDALAAATAQTRTALEERLDETTPAFVREFLLDWWARAAAEASLPEEGGEPRGADALQIAEALIWSIAPKTPEEVPRLAALLPKLINGLMRGVRRLGMPDAQRETFFNELLRAHTRGIEAAKQAQAARVNVVRAASRIRMRSDGAILYTPPRVAQAPVAAAPASLPHDPAAPALPVRGDEIELDGDAGTTSRFRVAWVSPSRKLYILSRYPDETRTLQHGELADLFVRGRARIVERRATVDRVIDHLTAEAAPAR